MLCLVPKELEEGAESPGSGFKDDCDVGTGN